MAVFDRVTFERKEMQQGDDSGRSSPPRRYHRIGGQLCECVLVYQHQVQGKALSVDRIELKKSWTFAK